MLLNDLTPAASASSDAPDGGWTALMEMAASFPLETFTFGVASAAAPLPYAPADLLPRPRTLAYEAVIDLVDGAGDGPLIGLGTACLAK